MPGRCLSIFGFGLYNKQCSGSTHIAINSHSLLPPALNSGLVPRGQMLRAGALTTCIFLPFSGSPRSCCQDGIAELFFLLTERWLWNQDKSFSLPASMAMLWHTSQPSATLTVGKEHATATTLFVWEERHQLSLWRLLRVLKLASHSPATATEPVRKCCPWDHALACSEKYLPQWHHTGVGSSVQTMLLLKG